MIPALIQIPRAPFAVLPPGIHEGTLEEVEQRFAFNVQRKRLFGGLLTVTEALKLSGCTQLYLDGSFVTDKPNPNDYDGCWDPTGVNLQKLDPVLLDFSNGRAAQKQKYLGEMFVATINEVSGKTFLEFFQVERSSGAAKGIVLLRPQNNKVAP